MIGTRQLTFEKSILFFAARLKCRSRELATAELAIVSKTPDDLMYQFQNLEELYQELLALRIRVRQAERANARRTDVGPKTKTGNPARRKQLVHKRARWFGRRAGLRDVLNLKILDPPPGAKLCGQPTWLLPPSRPRLRRLFWVPELWWNFWVLSAPRFLPMHLGLESPIELPQALLKKVPFFDQHWSELRRDFLVEFPQLIDWLALQIIVLHDRPQGMIRQIALITSKKAIVFDLTLCKSVGAFSVGGSEIL
jgi:hypothetical protein